MKKSRSVLALLLLTIISVVFAGCGSDSAPASPGVLSVTTASLPGATVGTAYSQTLAASGGTGAYTWSISAGALPAGLVLNASSGLISGNPTTAGAAINFTVMVTDSAAPTANTATKALSIAVTAPAALSITTTSPLPAGTVGTVYTPVTLVASGGTPSYTWTIAAGSALPAGLVLSTGGIISGTPTTAGTVSTNITVTDAAAGTVTNAFSITVSAAAPPALNTLTPSCVTACHGLPPTTVIGVAGSTSTMPHTTNTMCGVCHVIGGWVPGTTTFNMSGVATHNNGTINILAGLPTASCGACHGLPPVSAIHPSVAVRAYAANCGICHPVGPGNPITMGIGTHDNGVINFIP